MLLLLFDYGDNLRIGVILDARSTKKNPIRTKIFLKSIYAHTKHLVCISLSVRLYEPLETNSCDDDIFGMVWPKCFKLGIYITFTGQRKLLMRILKIFMFFSVWSTTNTLANLPEIPPLDPHPLTSWWSHLRKSKSNRPPCLRQPSPPATKRPVNWVRTRTFLHKDTFDAIWTTFLSSNNLW